MVDRFGFLFAQVLPDLQQLDDTHNWNEQIQIDNGDCDMLSVRDAALEYFRHGLRVIPIIPDGSKGSKIKWRSIKSDESISQEKFDKELFPEGSDDGIGLLLGEYAGNMFVVDIEYADFFERFLDIFNQVFPGLIERVPIVITPGKTTVKGTGERINGVHLYFRSKSKVIKNEKYASLTEEEAIKRTGDRGRKTAIEIKGEGGYCIVPGGNPKAHESQIAYERHEGVEIWDAPVLEDEECDAIIDIIRSLDEQSIVLSEKTCREKQQTKIISAGLDDRPGSWFEQYDGVSIDDLLSDYFTYIYTNAQGVRYYRRKGKSKGVSATFNFGGSGVFYVFTSSAAPFEMNTSYTKFGVYATVSGFGSDFSKAAKHLRVQYGSLMPRSEWSKKQYPNSKIDLDEDDDDGVGISNGVIAEALPFPIEVLPGDLREYAIQTAKSIKNSPIDFCATQMLAIASVAIGKSRSLSPKDGHEVFANMWLLVIAENGSAKTPVFNAVRSPLDDFEDLFEDQYKLDYAQYQQIMAETEDVSTPVPSMRRLIVGDSTWEGLAPILEKNPRGVGIFRDEIATWIKSMNQFKGSGGADRESWLECWSLSNITIDRKSQNGIPIRVGKPYVSLVGGIQPDKVHLFTHGDNDGFKERFLFCYPSMEPSLKYSKDVVDREIKEKWINVITRILNPNSVSVASLVKEECETIKLTLDDNADKLHTEFHDSLDNEWRDPNFDKSLFGVYTKLSEYARKLAIILHELYMNSDDPSFRPNEEYVVNGLTMKNAIKLANYFKSHTIKAQQLSFPSEWERAIQSLFNWVKNQEGGVVTLRAAQTNTRKIAKRLPNKQKGKSLYIELFTEMHNRKMGVLSNDMKTFRLYQKYV